MAANRASEGVGHHGAIRIRRRYAETEERYHEHLLERQLEALAREVEPEQSAAAEPAKPAAPLPGAKAARPVETPEDGLLRQAVIEAGKRLDEIAAASRAFLTAARGLARLPLETLRNWQRRTGRRPGWT